MLQKLFRKPLVELEHMCYNTVAMLSNSSQSTNLAVRLRIHPHNALVPLRLFGGSNILPVRLTSLFPLSYASCLSLLRPFLPV